MCHQSKLSVEIDVQPIKNECGNICIANQKGVRK